MLVYNAAMAVFLADSRHSNGRDHYRGGDADDGGDGDADGGDADDGGYDGCVDGDGDADVDEAEDADEDEDEDGLWIMSKMTDEMLVEPIW